MKKVYTEHNNTKIIIPILVFVLLVILVPKIYNFIQKDSCLDAGGSYNEATKKCETGGVQVSPETKPQEHSEAKPQEYSETKSQAFLEQITYSNLADKSSQDEVKRAFLSAGIDEQNVKNFFESVDSYNTTMRDQKMTSGFEVSKNLHPKYDEAMLMTTWETKNPEFPGHNCRITSYNLMRNFVKVEKPETNSKNLFIDLEAISTDSQKLFSDEEQTIFESFYSQIPTTLTKDISTHLAKVKKNWQEKGITFPFKNDKTKASLVSVFFHSYFEATGDIPEENNLFIGHIGVLVPTSDGLIFVEKISFTEPYQALKFKNRVELNDYLMNKYDVEYNQPTASPFILENDELLEGYRPNPNKQRS